MRAALTFVMVAVAVLAQAAVVNRLPLDWPAGPDLVVGAVAVVALTTGPAVAAACGFAAGLALDALPPAEHTMGTHTLLLCLAGYVISLLYRNTGMSGSFGGRVSAWTALGVTLLAALAMGVTFAAIGFFTGDPRVDLPGAALTVGIGTAATAVVSPLVVLPILWVRNAFAEVDFATVQGPMSPGGW
ncbi:rod shape-determining protein MreD [Nocardiopsis sp. HNM0947]|uniref:Rod shape-determining protein MreD n=1 Tax=Nocardiopsis coralli TaxID=2772213 RepID=A0ABR9P3S2_9ACTN|nr:rod shape-determining protein MreD [Nocardiopsis coralli]MBE2998491.1 rod shape-determining protein MreD [Nocardiopsis coralli]